MNSNLKLLYEYISKFPECDFESIHTQFTTIFKDRDGLIKAIYTLLKANLIKGCDKGFIAIDWFDEKIEYIDSNKYISDEVSKSLTNINEVCTLNEISDSLKTMNRLLWHIAKFMTHQMNDKHLAELLDEIEV